MNASLSSVPFVLAAGCRLVGSFATLVGSMGEWPGSLQRERSGSAGGGWRGVQEELGEADSSSSSSSSSSLLPLALGYLSAGLQQEVSRRHAAIAIRTVGASCERAIIASGPALDTLLRVRSGSISLALARSCCTWRREALIIAGATFVFRRRQLARLGDRVVQRYGSLHHSGQLLRTAQSTVLLGQPGKQCLATGCRTAVLYDELCVPTLTSDALCRHQLGAGFSATAWHRMHAPTWVPVTLACTASKTP